MDGFTMELKEDLEMPLLELIKNMQLLFGDNLVKIILFGSYAREDNNKESDIDLIIMVNEDEKTLKQYRDKVLDIYNHINIKYDILIMGIIQDYQKFYKYLNVLPFYNNIQKEGIILYER